MRFPATRPPLVILLFSLLLFSAVGVLPCRGAEHHTQFNKKEEPPPPKRGNLFNLFFGTAPPMPTQRGTVIINAFHDRNGNHRRDPGEEELSGKITCTLDKIHYTVPAFVPGLTMGKDYPLSCTGKEFVPESATKDVFVEHRGEIIHLDLACRSASNSGKKQPHRSISER